MDTLHKFITFIFVACLENKTKPKQNVDENIHIAEEFDYFRCGWVMCQKVITGIPLKCINGNGSIINRCLMIPKNDFIFRVIQTPKVL